MDDPRPILAPPPRTDPIVIEGRAQVPVTLLTGFLGSGKTTLLNRILSGDHGLRVGVLVNDFGSINIDAALVQSIEENTISLVNGCVCCEIRDDLVASLEDLLARPEPIDYVIMEASGVADPAGIMLTFLDARYRQLLRIDSITCIVDAEAIFAQADDEQLNQLKLRQIAFADLVVVNKTDLVGPEHVQVVRDWIDLHIKRVRIIESVHGEVPLEILLSVGRFDATRLADTHEPDEGHSHGPDHGASLFDRWSYQAEEPFSRDKLSRMVKRELPASVYRCKGIVFTDDAPDQPSVLQVVGRRTDIAPFDGVWSGEKRSEIVAIGRGIDGPELDRLFAGCQSRSPAS